MPRTLSPRNILIAGASTAAVVAATTAAMVVPQHASNPRPVTDTAASAVPVAAVHDAKAAQAGARTAASAAGPAHREHLQARAHGRAAAHTAHRAHRAHATAEANAEQRARAVAAHADHRSHMRTEAHTEHQAGGMAAHADHRSHMRTEAHTEHRARAVAAHADHRSHMRTEAHTVKRVRAAARLAAERAAASRQGGSGPLPAVSGSPQQIAQQIVGDAVQFQCFSNIVEHESSWNPTAVNPSSGAYGLVQALPAGKMASAGADWRTNAATQIRWGVSYMDSRYGSACSAWGFWQAHHWY